MDAALRIKSVVNSCSLYDSIHILENDVVYVGGSLVEGIISPFSKGMGNKYSDLDVFIIREKEQFNQTKGDYKLNGKITYFSNCENESLDVEVIDYDVVKEIVTAIKNVDMSINERVTNMVTFPQDWDMWAVNSLLTRYRYSIPLQNKTEVDELLDNNVMMRFSHIYQYDILNTIDNLLEDVRGNLDSKEYTTALLLSREYCKAVMSYCLYCNDIFVDRDKWVWLKFKNMVTISGKYRALFENIKKLIFVSLNEEKIENSINECLYCVEKVVEEEMMGGIDL